MHGFTKTAIVLAVFSTTGCAIMQPIAQATKDSLDVIRPNSIDYRDATEEVDPTWNEVGDIGRGNEPFQQDPVPWLRKLTTSAKRRSIERNFRVE